MRQKPLVSFKDGFNAAIGWYVGQTIMGFLGLITIIGIIALLIWIF